MKAYFNFPKKAPDETPSLPQEFPEKNFPPEKSPNVPPEQPMRETPDIPEAPDPEVPLGPGPEI